MSQEDVEIVRRCYAALDRRDWESLWREAHPDFELRTQLERPQLGPNEAQAFIEDQFAAFESWKVEPEELLESDDQVVALVVVRSRPRGSSAEITIKIAHVSTLRNRKVLVIETFPQREKALEAAGLSD
jgi:ketosteroid isomerase-like protein